MAFSSKQPFEVNDFSFGLTDDPFEKDPRYSTELDNFNVEPDGSIRSRKGSLVEDLTNPQIPSGIERIGALINYDNSANLLVQSLRQIFYRNPSAYSTLQGPTGNDVFSSGDETNNVSFSEWNKQVFITSDDFPRPMKIYKDSGGTLRVNTSGLPALASSPTVTPVAGANSYVYAFHHYYTYTVGSQSFEDVGPITQVSITNAAAPNVSTVAITAIPVLANGVTDNWATTAVKIQIYRTTNAGTIFYKVGEVTNGTTTFNDTMSDTTLQTQVLIYTADGTVEFDPVPLHKFVHIINNTAYYGFIKVGSVEFPFKIRQSIPGAPSGAPEDFELDVEDTLTGIGSVNSIPIVFCKRHVYRLENNFDQFGRGGINQVRISDTAGCISHLSIVSSEGYIFWAGTDGFYASDGYKVQKISDKLNSRYRLMLEESDDPQRIYGKFDEEHRRIHWAIQQNSSNVDNDSFINLELRWGVKPNSVFTTYSGDSFRPTAIEFFNNTLYRANESGYVFYHDDTTLTDPKVDTNAAAADWAQETIIWEYISCNFDFGSTFFRKMPTRMLLTARNIANTSIQIISLDDDGKRSRELKPIRWRRNFTWGDNTFVWGDPDCIWKSLGVIEQWRRFPARGLRLSYCQIKVTNARAVVVNSDLFGNSTFLNSANTVTLDNAATFDWPEDSVGYVITTAADNYVREFEVAERTSADVLTVADPTNNLPNGSYKWLLKGYKKGEPLNLQGYCIHIANVDQNQLTYESGDDGANA